MISQGQHSIIHIFMHNWKLIMVNRENILESNRQSKTEGRSAKDDKARERVGLESSRQGRTVWRCHWRRDRQEQAAK